MSRLNLSILSENCMLKYYLLKMTSFSLGVGIRYMVISTFLRSSDHRNSLLFSSMCMLASKLGLCFNLTHSPAQHTHTPNSHTLLRIFNVFFLMFLFIYKYLICQLSPAPHNKIYNLFTLRLRWKDTLIYQVIGYKMKNRKSVYVIGKFHTTP